ncbi:MAG: hypothetical protein Q4G35_05275 [Propionibacteriaceae bacterium]|nr:hypothetical protein [Propionibacteriaceae bacterium]
MIWVIVLLSLALAGCVALAVFAVSLAHKVADVKAEIRMLNQRSDELRTLVGQLELSSGHRD